MTMWEFMAYVGAVETIAIAAALGVALGFILLMILWD